MKPTDTSEAGMMHKGANLLALLKATATIRRKRVSSYGPEDKVLWFTDIPRDRGECRSPFLTDQPEESTEFWLEVCKNGMPPRPPVPQLVSDWVRADELDNLENEPELRPEITVLVERRVPDPDAPPDAPTMIVETVPELRRLADHPEVEEAWLEYLVEKWEPWAQEMRRWQEVQTVYETLDFMRRRLEEAEERYELVLAIGFLQWRDPTGTDVQRHVLTAPAELTLDAARGILTVVPAASFDGFRVELDMLEPQHRPQLNKHAIGERLEALDIQAWDARLVAPLLREIANSLRADAQVDETFQRAARIDERPRLSFAPALVLRQRQQLAYEELIHKFLEAANNGELESTQPWSELLREGEAPNGGPGFPLAAPEDDPRTVGEPARFLFPLPTNEEQRQIVYRLQTQPCVLVKGPPGTGKSHTIANLICHLLANGERVLVTAHAPKALAVLRGLLPDDIRDLCVTALGSSRDDQRLLEESVRGILRRKNEWLGSAVAQREIEEAESVLRHLEGELARVTRDLYAFREAETHSHTLPGGYSGTAAQIARALYEQEEEFGWFPEVPADASFSLDPAESSFLAEAHARFTADARAELELEIGPAEFPGPDDFKALIERLMAAEESAQRASRRADAAKLEVLEQTSREQLNDLRSALRALTDLALKASRVLGDFSVTILEDLLASADARWSRLAADSEALVTDAIRLREAIRAARVELPEDIAEERLRTDVDRRLAHFENGGRKGFWVFAPRVVCETQYIVERCRVDGQKPTQIEQLRCLRDYLELRGKIRALRDLWGASLPEALSPGQAISRAEELTAELKALLSFFQSKEADLIVACLGPKYTTLAHTTERDDWLRAIDALLASQEARDARNQLDQLLAMLRSSQNSSKAHPCLRALEEAARARDMVAWHMAWQERERLREDKQRLDRYERLLKKLDALCPGIAEFMRTTGGDPKWHERVRKLQQAWYWAAAHAWLRRFSDASAYEACVQEYHRLQQKIEKATEKLVSLRAWRAFFERLDHKTGQSLIAWTKAMDRIGKGTGKHAYRHRRTARRYLMECVPSITAWVMPLHKLWESVDAIPGLFGTVIVDEASQAGVDALLLFLIAKRIIVVGDDKQNSPEAVGVLEDDIARLAREHLGQFRFRDEFRPDTSLFDHAERTFGSHITLREHFRCVPEIIRFSNDLCYRDAPLIPLRQAPPKRLPPLRSVFIPEGACEGTGQRIQNRAEAETLVETIVKLVDDDAYEGKTMGVIALQGHAQAQLIERLLAQRLDPKVIADRRLRCGEPATFQGDQRDVIFLSLVIAPNVNYRALTRLQDQRRFNVAMSRARDQVWLFYSVKQHDIAPDDLRRRLISFFESPQNAAVDALFEELDRLEREARGLRQLGNQPEPYESWFEVDVALELLRQRFRIRPQVEVAGYRIDLVVEGINTRLAVECDGDAWHGPEQYERDMARQRQLERAGWTFVRVRESDFYTDRQRAIMAVLEACEELGIRPVDFADEPQREPAGDSATNRGGRSSAKEETEETSVASEDLEENAIETDVSSLSVGPFTGYSEASGFPDPREASPANIRDALRKIIEQDGPLTRASVYRLYVEGCPALQRAGKSVRQALDRALGAMLRAGEIVQEDELRDGSPEGKVLRLSGTPRVKVRPAGRRDLLEIPPSELLAVLRLRHKAEILASEDNDALFRTVLEHYGFTRLTTSRKEYLSRVIQRASSVEGGKS
jgi:very-short-patch-repair endonuclease